MTCFDPTLPRFIHLAVTLRLADAQSDLLFRQIALLRDCVSLAQHRWPFEIEAACVLPAEMLMLCRLPEHDDMAGRLRLIRSAFARHGSDQGSGLLWERDTQIAEIPASAVQSRARFILDAPVRAGLVKRAEDWVYSSLHKRGAPQVDLQVA